MFKANGERTSQSDRGIKQALPRIYIVEKESVYLTKGVGRSCFSFSVSQPHWKPGNWPPYPIEQEDAATYRCECQEGTKSQLLGPHYGQKITPRSERPETHS